VGVRSQIEILGDFWSDGCSKSPDFAFRHCCVAHDYLYVTGYCSRKEADEFLRDCIIDMGYPRLAWVYYYGVRIGGKRAWDRYRRADA
jgi:hypothetical protein